MQGLARFPSTAVSQLSVAAWAEPMISPRSSTSTPKMLSGLFCMGLRVCKVAGVFSLSGRLRWVVHYCWLGSSRYYLKRWDGLLMEDYTLILVWHTGSCAQLPDNDTGYGPNPKT